MNIKLKPFSVPNYVVEDTDWAEPSSYPLSQVSRDELEEMIEDFRHAVLVKAGYVIEDK